MFKIYDKTCPDCGSMKVNIYVYGEWGEPESIEKPGQIWNGFIPEEVDRYCGECTLEWSSEDKFCSECGTQEGTCECRGVCADQEDGPVEVANTCQLSQPPVIYRTLLPVCRHKTLWPLKPLVEGSSPSGRT